MDRSSYFMLGNGRTLYSGPLPNLRLRLLLRKVLLTAMLAAAVIIGIRAAWIIGHDRKHARQYDPVVYVAGGLIWIEEAEETWRLK